jgi:hypothetical protein
VSLLHKLLHVFCKVLPFHGLEKTLQVFAGFDYVLQALYCYYPRTNIVNRVKQMELPDKQHWSSYKIRVLSFTGTTTFLMFF